MARIQTFERGGMKYRLLGSTGVEVSVIGIGGFHIGEMKLERDSTRVIRAAIDAGVNFMDNSWDYHDGRSEIRMGKALKGGYRDRVFLMTKIDGRTKKAAMKQLDASLKRLGTDRIDLLQHHEVIRMEDADRIFARGGAHEAMLEAQQAGKIRFVGFTGHKDPAVHLRALEVATAHGVRFDTVQMPLNVLDASFRSFEKQVLPILTKDGIGVLGMKSMGAGSILKTKLVTPRECIQYVLSLPVSTLIVGITSMRVLNATLETVRELEPLTRAEAAALVRRVAGEAATGKAEPFKTTPTHDATARNPDWLG